MRSRYTAYVLWLADYLRDTWAQSTRPAEAITFEPGLRWLGLAVHRHVQLPDGGAVVEFVARSKRGGRAHRLQEVSRFVLEHGQWVYVDGDVG